MRYRLVICAVIASLWSACARADEPWTTHLYGTHTLLGVLETTDANESSGVIAARSGTDVFWTHNDSGNAARLYAVRLNADDRAAGVARLLGHVEFQGITNIDWEDIARGKDDYLCIFDGGDNNAVRNNKRIIRFHEPAVNPANIGWSMGLPREVARFEYPDAANPSLPATSNSDRYDAECLFVHPATGDLYVITKRNHNGAAVARVYRLPGDQVQWDGVTVNVLQFVRDISNVVPSMVTAGDIDSAGRRLVLRTYVYAYEFILPAGEAFDTIFARSPAHIVPLGECQGEGICYSADQRSLITTSEAVLQFFCPARMPVSIVPWQLANIRVETVQADRATIGWETAGWLDSRVDYGTTAAYGLVAENPIATTHHQITLTSLDPETMYYYRVRSGSLVYPSMDSVELFRFMTAPLIRADFDRDRDVDQEDFGQFQRCYSGATVPQIDPDCSNAKLDGDNDVDLDDFSIFQQCMSGADTPADPSCDL